MNPFVKFALFGVLAPILIGLLYFSVMNQAATSATRDLTSIVQRQSASVVDPARLQQAAAASRSAEAQRAKLEARAAEMRAQADTARVEQAQAARKEAAWVAFFKPRKACDDPADWDAQVECGNAHMRAKREFEERWARGEFQRP